LVKHKMKKLMRRTGQGQKGFTLIELVVVIAILGVMAAIAVPMVNNFLSSSKEQAYIADRETIQAAVSGYYSSPGNERFEGRRQYPIIGANKTGALVSPDGNGTADVILNPIEGNPLLEPLPVHLVSPFFGLAQVAGDERHGDGGEHPDDGDDHHQLHQGEPSLAFSFVYG